MITEHQELAKLKIDERIHARERKALEAERRTTAGPSPTRRRLAEGLHRLADRVAPPATHHRSLSVVR